MRFARLFNNLLTDSKTGWTVSKRSYSSIYITEGIRIDPQTKEWLLEIRKPESSYQRVAARDPQTREWLAEIRKLESGWQRVATRE